MTATTTGAAGGYLFSWGLASEGTLGHCNTERDEEGTGIKPHRVNDQIWRQISCGSFHVVGISDGKLYSWGRCSSGRLGHSVKDEFVDQPTIIKHVQNIHFIQVACGYHHTLALTDSGQIFSWGSSFSGQCGQGSRADVLEPTIVRDTPYNSKSFLQVAAGYYHSMAIDEDHQIWTWGTGQKGQLGHGSDIKLQLKPKIIEFPEKILFKFIAAGELNSLAITVSGDIMMWGTNQYGQLCTGKIDKKNKFSAVPTFINNPKKIQFKYAALGINHVLAISEKNNLYIWGRSVTDLGVWFSNLTKIKCPVEGVKFVHVATSAQHVLATTDKGTIFAWGAGAYGQLAVAHTDTISTPTFIPGFKHVMHVACGYYFSLAISIYLNERATSDNDDDDERGERGERGERSERVDQDSDLVVDDCPGSPSTVEKIPPLRHKTSKLYKVKTAPHKLAVQHQRRSSPRNKSPRRKSPQVLRSAQHCNKSPEPTTKKKKRPGSQSISMPPLPIGLIPAQGPPSPKKQSPRTPQTPHRISVSDIVTKPDDNVCNNINNSLQMSEFTKVTAQKAKVVRPYRSLSARPHIKKRSHDSEMLKLRKSISPPLSPKSPSPHNEFYTNDTEEHAGSEQEDKINKKLIQIHKHFLQLAKEEEDLFKEEERLRLARLQLQARRRALAAQLGELMQ